MSTGVLRPELPPVATSKPLVIAPPANVVALAAPVRPKSGRVVKRLKAIAATVVVLPDGSTTTTSPTLTPPRAMVPA